MNRALWLALGVWVATAGTLAAETTRGLSLAFTSPDRFAIVVGNQDYRSVPDLANARRDAEDMAQLLRQFGFVVFDGYDIGRRGFETLLRTAMMNVPDGAEVVFYYAGHGIQIGRRNYLLPVDVNFDDIYDLPVETMTLDRVIDALSARGAAHVAIIDACRQNPFPDVKLAGDLGTELFETKSGFDVFRTPLNSLVAFSTSPGELAMDGAAGKNSPYTAAILTLAGARPDESVVTLFSKVREAVYESTGGRQIPWESSTLVRPFRFMDGAAPVLAQLTQEPDSASSGDRGGTVDSTVPTVVHVVPESVTLNLAFGPEVPLTAALDTALGVDVTAARLLAEPPGGSLRLDPGGALTFVPRLAEVRTTGMDSYATTAGFAVEFADPDGGLHPVTVDLTLTADACDVQAGDAVDLDGSGLYRLANEIDVTAALNACTAAMAANPDVARFEHQLGRAQQAAGEFEAALASFESAASRGHTRALHNAGYLYRTPRINRDIVDIQLDRDKARRLYEAAIAAGDPFAMNALGIDLLRNGTTEAERQRGFELLERAVELGHTYAMNELGIYFLGKDTDHYQPGRGMSYLQASFDRDDIYGFANMGFVAINGLDGTEPDFARGFEMFRKASDGGHPTAPAMLGRMILRGQAPGNPSRAEALRWYDLGLGRGDAWGGTNGAVIIANGDVPGMGPADAALRAAKAMHLADDTAVSEAAAVLDKLRKSALDRALQLALRDLGAAIAVDGVVGPGTLGALDKLRLAAGLPAAENTPRARLLLATQVFWAQKPARPDLF